MPATTINWNIISAIEANEEGSGQNMKSQFHIRVKDMLIVTLCKTVREIDPLLIISSTLFYSDQNKLKKYHKRKYPTRTRLPVRCRQCNRIFESFHRINMDLSYVQGTTLFVKPPVIDVITTSMNVDQQTELIKTTIFNVLAEALSHHARVWKHILSEKALILYLARHEYDQAIKKYLDDFKVVISQKTFRQLRREVIRTYIHLFRVIAWKYYQEKEDTSSLDRPTFESFSLMQIKNSRSHGV